MGQAKSRIGNVQYANRIATRKSYMNARVRVRETLLFAVTHNISKSLTFREVHATECIRSSISQAVLAELTIGFHHECMESRNRT
jgi:hypothetical protein